jgi:hypothetical protein
MFFVVLSVCWAYSAGAQRTGVHITAGNSWNSRLRVYSDFHTYVLICTGLE